MDEKNQKIENENVFSAFDDMNANPDNSDPLVEEFKQRLEGFHQDLRFHPYVARPGRFRLSGWRKILPHLPMFIRLPAMTIALLVFITIGLYFLMGKNTPTWAEVNKHLGKVRFFSGSYYLRTRSFFDSTRQDTVTDRILRSNIIDDTIQMEYWKGGDGRIRVAKDRTVTFAKKGEFVKTFDLVTRKEINPDIFIIHFLGRRGYIDYWPQTSRSPNRFDFSALFRGKIDDTAEFVTTHTEISKDIIIFDVESAGGASGTWKFRIWALRSTKLPIRILGRNSAGIRIDIIYSFSQEQPEAFFDPDVFEAKLKDQKHGVLSLMYLGMEG